MTVSADPAERGILDTSVLIAATAHAHHARLYSRNAADFTGLEDLVDVVEV